jgi:hypothetical protein
MISSMEITHADASRRVSFMNRGLKIEECIPRMLSFQGKVCNAGHIGHSKPSRPVPIAERRNRLPRKCDDLHYCQVISNAT